MANDHYVAQTYLKHFGDASRNGMLNAFRKSDGKQFPCHPRDVCREWDGDLNPRFLTNNPALLGDFRKIAEPRWNPALASLASGKTISASDKFVVSAMMASLACCTPAWRRMLTKMHDDMAVGFLRISKTMIDGHGEGPPDFPRKAVEMLEQGKIRLQTDHDFVKASVTRFLLDYTWVAFNQNWTIIRNNTEQPFLTSDNPVVVSASAPEPMTRFLLTVSGSAPAPMTRFLPLSPNLCLGVTFDGPIRPLDPKNPSLDLQTPPRGSITYQRAKPMAVRIINRLVVKCAEDLVFSAKADRKIEELVKKYAAQRVDAVYAEFPAPGEDAIYQGVTIQVRDTR